jgi:hypothetical protein
MHLDLTDDETAALIRELHDIVENDRYPFSPRIPTPRAILAKLRPEPVREPLAIHLEPGLWVRVDPTAAPNPLTPESYVRLATIPHGDSLLALSTFAARLNTGPTINPVDSTPFTGDIPDLNSSPASPVTSSDYLSPYRETPLPTECLPAGLDAVQTIKNPALVLLAAIANQTITEASRPRKSGRMQPHRDLR